MRHPVQALLWEQWRQTWKVIPFSLAMMMIILWFLPQYFLEYNIDNWSTEVGLIMCGILSGIFCIALQGEGGARGLTQAKRHFVLPVSSFLIAAIPVVVFCTILLGTLGVAIAFIVFYEQTSIMSLLQPSLFFRNVLLIACFVLAYSLTIGTRDNPLLRILLALLVLFILVVVGQSLAEVLPAAAVTVLALGISLPVAAVMISRERHRRALRQGAASVLRPVAALADQVQKMTLRIPGNPDAALLWNDLRGGNKLLLPVVIALSGVLIFLAGFCVGVAGLKFLTRLNVPEEVSDLWAGGITLTGAGLLIYIVARLGPRMAGRSNLFAPWSAETSFWKRQAVMGHALATVKLTSIMLQCLCWSMCLCLVVAFIPIFIEIFNRGHWKVLRDASGQLQENGVIFGISQLVARPVFITVLALWSISGLIAAIALTGRRLFYTFAFTTLAFAALAGLRLASLSNSWEYFIAIQSLKEVFGILIILLSIAPLVWSFVRGYADRLTLLMLITGFLIAEAVIFSAAPSRITSRGILEAVQPLKGVFVILIILLSVAPLGWSIVHGYVDRLTLLLLMTGFFIAEAVIFSAATIEVTFPGILELSMYAIPFAPLGLLPIAVQWGRRL